jgi:hypothetical protein
LECGGSTPLWIFRVSHGATVCTPPQSKAASSRRTPNFCARHGQWHGACCSLPIRISFPDVTHERSTRDDRRKRGGRRWPSARPGSR